MTCQKTHVYIHIYVYWREIMGLLVSAVSVFSDSFGLWPFWREFFHNERFTDLLNVTWRQIYVHLIFPYKVFLSLLQQFLMIVQNEHKICSKSELRRYWVLDSMLSVLESQVLVSRNFLYSQFYFYCILISVDCFINLLIVLFYI